MEQMSVTARFVRPFVRVLSRYPDVAVKLDQVRALPPERRVDLQEAYDTVSYWVRSTGDADLGLKAGQTVCLGGGGVLEFAMHSAASLRESMSVARRYSRLFSDALEPKLEIEGDRAVVKLDNKLAWPRAIADFTLSAWYTNHIRTQLADVPDVAVLFNFDRPDDVSTYERTFGSCRLQFGAGCDGFAFEASFAERALASSDALLHAVHCEHLEVLHAGLPAPMNVALRVRQLVASELRRGRPTAVAIARQLHMSRRTLVRRLDAEGTSFTAELDELRRELALRFVSSPNLPLNEITTLLGFSHVQGFHRAFKRWTGQTPIQFRESAAVASATAAQ
jgi:AraC-like DNA-binding protein